MDWSFFLFLVLLLGFLRVEAKPNNPPPKRIKTDGSVTTKLLVQDKFNAYLMGKNLKVRCFYLRTFYDALEKILSEYQEDSATMTAIVLEQNILSQMTKEDKSFRIYTNPELYFRAAADFFGIRLELYKNLGKGFKFMEFNPTKTVLIPTLIGRIGLDKEQFVLLDGGDEVKKNPSNDEYVKKCVDLVLQKMTLTKEEQESIEKATAGSLSSMPWVVAANKRFTCSKFGRISKIASRNQDASRPKNSVVTFDPEESDDDEFTSDDDDDQLFKPDYALVKLEVLTDEEESEDEEDEDEDKEKYEHIDENFKSTPHQYPSGTWQFLIGGSESQPKTKVAIQLGQPSRGKLEPVPSTHRNPIPRTITQDVALSSPLKFGIKYEQLAIELLFKLPEYAHLQQQRSFPGLRVSSDGIFAGIADFELPDKVGEVKSAFTAIGTSSVTEWIQKMEDERKDCYLEIDNSKPVLSKSHVYYAQVQGEMWLAKKTTAIFVVFGFNWGLNKQHGIFVSEVSYDKKWIDTYIPIMRNFYITEFIPRIIRHSADMFNSARIQHYTASRAMIRALLLNHIKNSKEPLSSTQLLQYLRTNHEEDLDAVHFNWLEVQVDTALRESQEIYFVGKLKDQKNKNLWAHNDNTEDIYTKTISRSDIVVQSTKIGYKMRILIRQFLVDKREGSFPDDIHEHLITNNNAELNDLDPNWTLRDVHTALRHNSWFTKISEVKKYYSVTVHSEIPMVPRDLWIATVNLEYVQGLVDSNFYKRWPECTPRSLAHALRKYMLECLQNQDKGMFFTEIREYLSTNHNDELEKLNKGRVGSWESRMGERLKKLNVVEFFNIRRPFIIEGLLIQNHKQSLWALTRFKDNVLQLHADGYYTRWTTEVATCHELIKQVMTPILDERDVTTPEVVTIIRQYKTDLKPGHNLLIGLTDDKIRDYFYHVVNHSQGKYSLTGRQVTNAAGRQNRYYGKTPSAADRAALEPQTINQLFRLVLIPELKKNCLSIKQMVQILQTYKANEGIASHIVKDVHTVLRTNVKQFIKATPEVKEYPDKLSDGTSKRMVIHYFVEKDSPASASSSSSSQQPDPSGKQQVARKSTSGINPRN